MEKEGEVSNYCSQTFTILDKWLNQVSKEKGEQALEIIKDALQTNIAANATYYESLAREAEKNGESEIAANCKLLAKIYKGLLE